MTTTAVRRRESVYRAAVVKMLSVSGIDGGVAVVRESAATGVVNVAVAVMGNISWGIAVKAKRAVIFRSPCDRPPSWTVARRAR